MSSKTLFSLALFVFIILVTNVAGGLFSNGNIKFSFDRSGSDLTKLYNSGVYKAERVERPLDGMSVHAGPFSHSGVRVTLADGSKWLIHKGNNFGVSSQTVVVNANHMSDKWKITETRDFKGSVTVSDSVKAGGTDYNLLFNNCHDGANQIMGQ